jgi:hypothetical protein
MRDLSTRSASPDQRDFRFVGIIWYVRVKQGWRSEFYRLADLRRYIAEGRIQPTDQLSYDREKWTRIDLIPDLDAYFEEVWHLANQGRIRVRHEIGRNRDFDECGPTSVYRLDELGLTPSTKPAADPLRLTPPDIEAMEMPEEEITGMYEAMDIEDEPTMEPPEPLRPAPPAVLAPAPATTQPPVEPPPGAILRVFLSGIVAGLLVFGALVWLVG